jgi:serine protease
VVMTTSDNGTGARNIYSATSFNSTSAASAIIAGAALSVQGMAVASTLGHRLGPGQMRAVLRDTTTGTPSHDPTLDRIGAMPDLEAIAMDVLSLLPDVYMRDHVGDDGDPHRGPVSISPDVIVTTAAVPDPQAAYGEGSGTENDFSLGDVVTPGVANNVFVRMRDRGGADATNVGAVVYWSPPATLVTPDLWNLIGSTTIARVPMGNVLTVSNAIPWPAASVPASGHACFVALIGNTIDPAPGPADFSDMDQFALFISRNNNVTWKNFNVVPVPPPAPMMAPMRMPFWLTGPHDKPHMMRVELVSQLPKGATAHLSIPEPAADLFKLSRHGLKKDDVGGRLLFPINVHGRHILGEAMLPKHLKAECDLVVQQPKDGMSKACEVSIRQFFNELEIGRITWRFDPHKEQ